MHIWVGVLKSLRWLIVIALVTAFVMFVWPTRFRYTYVTTDGDTYPVRIDRLNGDADMLTPDDGWYPMGDDSGAGDSSDPRTS